MLWPFILYRRGRRTPATVAHEHYHWYQCRRCWVLPYYLCYLILGLFYLPRKRWRQHPLEVYAYAVGAGAPEPLELAGKEGRTVGVPVRASRRCERPAGPPPHPGGLLGKLFLEGLGLTEEEFAERLGVSTVLLRAVLRGEEAVTADFALRMERVTWVGADFWLGLQNQCDQWQVSQSERGEAIAALEPLPLATEGQRREQVLVRARRAGLD